MQRFIKRRQGTSHRCPELKLWHKATAGRTVGTPGASPSCSRPPDLHSAQQTLPASGSQSTRCSTAVGAKATPRGSEPRDTPTCARAGAERPRGQASPVPCRGAAAAGGRTSPAPPPAAPPPPAPRTWPQRLGDGENQQEEQQEGAAVCLGHHLSSVHRPRGSGVTPRGGRTWPGGGREAGLRPGTERWRARGPAGPRRRGAAARGRRRLARTPGRSSGTRFRLAQDGGRPARARATPPPSPH